MLAHLKRGMQKRNFSIRERSEIDIFLLFISWISNKHSRWTLRGILKRETNVSQKPVEGNFALTSNERTNSTPSSPLSFRFLECGSFRRKGRRIQSQRNYIVNYFQCLGIIIQETLSIVREAAGKKGTLGRRIFPHIRQDGLGLIQQVLIFSVVTNTL